MQGKFLPVWSETWQDVWSKLAKHPNAPEDLFSELYRELNAAFDTALSAEAVADVVGISGDCSHGFSADKRFRAWRRTRPRRIP